jgi:predicted acetyltransferase
MLNWKELHDFDRIITKESILIKIKENLASEFLEKYIGHIGYDIRPSRRRKGYGNAKLRLGLLRAKEL